MRHVFVRAEKGSTAETLKKKLFVAGAYLAVSFLLLVLVSFGQYRIKVEGKARMPEAAGIEANLDLDNNLSETVNLGTYLTDLQPGDSARTYASTYSATPRDTTALNHKIQVKITNSVTTTVGEGEESTSTTVTGELNLEYTIRLTSNPGRIPLQFILVQGANKYISKPQADGKEYRFYRLTENGGVDDISEEETKFTLSAGPTVRNNTYQIFVGWDNTPENATSLTDAAFRKEVEMLEIRADIVAAAPTVRIPTESVLQEAIPTPTPEPTDPPDPTPTPPDD